MSAFQVSTHHIDAMITAGLRWAPVNDSLRWYWPDLGEQPDLAAISVDELRRMSRREAELSTGTAGRVGAMLLAENRRSVNHRYREDELEEPYLYTPIIGVPHPVIVLKAIRCYEYQTCEHPAWRYSEAYAFCQALLSRALHQFPGSDAAPWGIETRDVFPRADRQRF